MRVIVVQVEAVQASIAGHHGSKQAPDKPSGKHTHPQAHKPTKGPTRHHQATGMGNKSQSHGQDQSRSHRSKSTAQSSKSTSTGHRNSQTHVHCNAGYTNSGHGCVAISTSRTTHVRTTTAMSRSRASTTRPTTTSTTKPKITSTTKPTTTSTTKPTTTSTNKPTSTASTGKSPHPDPTPTRHPLSEQTPSDSPQADANGINGGAAAAIAVVVVVFVILLILSVFCWLGRRRKRRLMRQQGTPSSTTSRVQILGKGERATALPEVNRWSKVLPTCAEPQQLSPIYPNQKDLLNVPQPPGHRDHYLEPRRENPSDLRSSQCTTFTANLGRRAESLMPNEPPTVPAAARLQSSYVSPSSSLYSLDIPVYLDSTSQTNLRPAPRPYTNNSMTFQ